MTLSLTRLTRSSSAGDTELAAMVTDMLTEAMHSQPRSLQRRIGPSEIGDPCSRRMSYKISGYPPARLDVDKWLAFIGTAVHAELAEVLGRVNQRLQRTRWLVEQRVRVTDDLSGSLDAYDVDTGTVVDWKVVGKTTLHRARKVGPGPTYRTQIHTYGAGLLNAGHAPRKVAIVFLPRNEPLRNLFVWSEPFTTQPVTDALRRVDVVRRLVELGRPQDNPGLFARIPRASGPTCEYCPWLRPGPDTGVACPGNLA